MNIEEVRGALARGYCAKGQTHKIMDPDLCEAQAQEVMALLPKSVEAAPDNERDPYREFETELSGLINRYSLENRTNTPDFILATYLVETLRVLEHYHHAKRAWGKVPVAEVAD